MESNKNYKNNNGGDEHEQLQKSARKRTLNELTNDERKQAAGEEDANCTNSKKNREEGNDLDLESLKLETSTTMEPSSADRHRKLPPELNCQIFYCLNLPTRLKFICGLGWNFYAMFRRSLLIKSKRLCNAKRNSWSRSNGNVKISEGSNGNVTISEDGLIVTNNTNEWQHLHAKKGFPISVADCRIRMDDFPGTICYYYEVKSLSDGFSVGLIADAINSGIVLCLLRNRCVIATLTDSRLGDYELIQMPAGARPEQNVQENVYGCGILMDPDNKLTIFFTLNGIFLGKRIPIIPSVDRFYPAVAIFDNALTMEANFGDDKEKPFQYDINKCPGMELDCI